MTDITIDKFDQELAAAAVQKRRAGEKPTRDELRALKRVLKSKEEDARWKFYSSIPQRHWIKMSGRQAKVVNEQAILYNIPFGGKTISLPEVVKALHDFLAKNAAKLRNEDPDPILNGPDSPWLEEIRKAEAGLRNIKLEREQKTHVNILDLMMSLKMSFEILRRTGSDLQRNYGEGAAVLFNDGLDRVLERCNSILTNAQAKDGA
jgi:hypothetical protein